MKTSSIFASVIFATLTLCSISSAVAGGPQVPPPFGAGDIIKVIGDSQQLKQCQKDKDLLQSSLQRSEADKNAANLQVVDLGYRLDNCMRASQDVTALRSDNLALQEQNQGLRQRIASLEYQIQNQALNQTKTISEARCSCFPMHNGSSSGHKFEIIGEGATDGAALTDATAKCSEKTISRGSGSLYDQVRIFVGVIGDCTYSQKTVPRF